MPEEKQKTRPGQLEGHWLYRWGIRSWLFLGFFGAVVVAYYVYARAHQVLLPLIFAVILGILLEPLVTLLTRHHFPRWLATVVTMMLIIVVVAGFFTLIIYGVVDQAHSVEKQVEEGTARIESWFDNLKISKSLHDWVEKAITKAWPQISNGVVTRVAATVPGLASFAIGAFISFFILLFLLGDDGAIKCYVAGHMGVPRERGEAILAEVFSSVRGYFKGTTIVAAVNAVVVIPVVLILGIPLVGAITLVTFVTCYIPSFGGYIGGAFAVFIALASKGLTAGIIMLVFSIIAHTILQAPVQAIAYGKTLKLHPLVALLATLLGMVFMGLAGAILAVPIVAVFLKTKAMVASAREEEGAGGGEGPAGGEAPEECASEAPP